VDAYERGHEAEGEHDAAHPTSLISFFVSSGDPPVDSISDRRCSITAEAVKSRRTCLMPLNDFSSPDSDRPSAEATRRRSRSRSSTLDPRRLQMDLRS